VNTKARHEKLMETEKLMTLTLTLTPEALSLYPVA